MATDRNRITEADLQKALTGPLWCFEAPQDDTEYLVHPITGEPLVSGAISLSTGATTLSVEFWNGSIQVFPINVFLAQVLYPLPIVKVRTTGTGSLSVMIWQGETLRNLRPASF